MEESKKETEKNPDALSVPPWKMKKSERILDIKADPKGESKSSDEYSASAKKLKRIGVLSMAKAYGVMGLIMGLVIALIYGGMFFILGSLSEELTSSAGLEAGLLSGFGIFAIFAIPIIYAVMGFFGGAIGAIGFNIVMKITGGIELEFEE